MLIFFMFNPFIPNAPFLHPLKTLENILVYWCFQAVERGCIGNRWVKCLWLKSDVKKPQRNKLISNINPNFDIGLYHQKITPNFPDVSLLLLKGSLYSSFYILAVSQSCFLAYLDATFKTCHTFSERLKFVVFKIEKTALKNLNKEEHGQSDNENLKPLKELLCSYCQHFLDFFFNRWVILLSNKIFSENSFDGLLDGPLASLWEMTYSHKVWSNCIGKNLRHI